MLSHLRKLLSLPSISTGHAFLQNAVQPVFQANLKNMSSLSSFINRVEPAIPDPTSNSSPMRLLKSENSAMHQCVRTKVRVYYKGSAWKRYNKHNIEKRLTTPGGLEMLWRKTLKGRMNLAPYERILPNTVDCKILPAHHFKYKAHPLTKRRLPKPGLF
ncbi:hypothetical protein EGW08_015818 [Elysia chlorotica]|uniref:Uncharacterized protein n=1 Tax=Elysia chlorotica TaxID=188477 RepID=A0A433T4E7_ELYCH|nr:hypothetical protein EGW08_015818 [Elysia chlorotica]